MKELLARLFLKNWPRKLVAILSAVVIWFLVNETITISRTIPDVPVRVINIPSDKTVVGLLPNGYLKHHTSITITGMKSAVEDIRSNSLEIVIDAENRNESWIATIDKKNLFSRGETQDELKKHITSLEANDLFIKVSKLVTDEIPVTIIKPIGDPPKGYQFLDIWPKYLTQKVSGPQEQIQALKEKGLELTFNLNRISLAELEAIRSSSKTDEISYRVPNTWKMVSIPFHDDTLEPLNDPRAKFLRIDFLKQELIPLGIELPITIFYPIKYSLTMNPQTYSLAVNDHVHRKNGLKLFAVPLYVRDVSRLFLDIVRDNLLLIVVAAPQSVQENLSWAVEFIDEKALEDAFVEASIQEMEELFKEEPRTQFSEQAIRYRFRDYLRNLVLFTENGRPLRLKTYLDASTIIIEQLTE